MNKLSNLPPKGTADWFPQEFAIRKYIFDTWRKVCLSFGYEEYLTPIIESADVYRAKSGEDVGGKELMTMTDRAGRELAIRPEMTPSVTRMVTRIYGDTPKPIRYFSIANYLRNEKPQRGRNREFWQLNFDIFGSDSLNADVEILVMGIEIMKAFGATEDNFVMYLNERNAIKQNFLEFKMDEEKVVQGIRLVDKIDKLPRNEWVEQFMTVSGETSSRADQEWEFYKSEKPITQNPQLKTIIEKLTELGYGKYIQYKPSLVRGFDYYDGMVFEVFDKNPENNRSLFGGGRYNGLASIFGSQSFPAVGCAPGDETTKLFLEAWNLIPQDLKPQVAFLPILGDSLQLSVDKLAQKLRAEGKNIEVGLESVKFNKAFEYANKKGFSEMIILGEDEQSRGVYKIKDMKSGEEREFSV